MLIVAHRGGNPDDIENSAGAFRHGIEVGADLLECDLQRSGTGDIVVFHNTRYFGTPISAFTTAELRVLIPTLLTFDDLLELINGIRPDARLVLDLKDRTVDRALMPYLADDQLRRRCLITSTFGFGLRRLKQRFPDLRTGLSRGAVFTRVPNRLLPAARLFLGPVMTLLAILQMRLLGIDTAVFHYELVNHDTVQRLNDLGLRLYVWTIDDPQRGRDLHRLGIDYLTTNDPARMIEYFDVH